MKARYTAQTTVQLTPEMRKWLEDHAEATDQKLADSIREMLNRGISAHQSDTAKARQLP